ncbi:MAG: hypothetical protein HYY04_03660, partial [Chloroflexi bacterium]|nr:hypothetical protein [Chloroflexota bacterium]
MIEPAPADETGSAAAKLSDSYLAEMLRIRATISRQSATLRQLGTLTADPSRAHRVRDELARAADAIAVLSPPLELDTAHEDFLEGTRELVRGFDELLEAGAALDAPRAHRVQRHIAEAASRFKRGADQFALQKADAVSLEEEMTMRPERAVLTDTSPDRGSGAPDPQS